VRGRTIPATALALCAVMVIAATSAVAATPRTSLPDVEDEVMCTICGTLLELSDSPQAQRERILIQRLIAQGKTKQEVKDALVREYGPQVLAEPPAHGFDLTAWLVPALGLLAGLTLIVVTVRRRTRRRGDGDEPPDELDEADSARLDRELSSYGR
jgi:cytochrome c-type biogenesis protein CcmH